MLTTIVFEDGMTFVDGFDFGIVVTEFGMALVAVCEGAAGGLFVFGGEGLLEFLTCFVATFFGSDEFGFHRKVFSTRNR